MILFALFRLAFASAPRLYRLTSHHIVTRRPVLQKVRHHTRMVLCLLVSTRFQVLFHSPPGVLFTFPSRYYSLSVTWSYLALWDGPHLFRQNSSCSDVLDVSNSKQFRLQACHFLRDCFPSIFGYRFFVLWYQQGISTPPSGSSAFARHYSRNRFYFLFLRVLRCFSSPGSPYIPMDSVYNNVYLYTLSSLIRISAGHGIFAPHRSFSQLVTSFFGAMYQGIPRMLFVAWSFLSISIILSYSFKIYSSSLQKFYTSNSSYSRLIFSYSKNSNCKIVTSFLRINLLIFLNPN